MSNEKISNDPKVLVEFDPDEISWLADRLHEMRSQWLAAQMMGAQLTSDGQEISEASADKLKEAQKQIEEHKRMEAIIRNRLLNKADDQGFGNL